MKVLAGRQRASSEGPRKIYLFHAFLLSSGSVRCSLAITSSSCLFSHLPYTPVCLCVQISSLYRVTSHSESGPTLMSFFFFASYFLFQDHIAKHSHILWYWG